MAARGCADLEVIPDRDRCNSLHSRTIQCQRNQHREVGNATKQVPGQTIPTILDGESSESSDLAPVGAAEW